MNQSIYACMLTIKTVVKLVCIFIFIKPSSSSLFTFKHIKQCPDVVKVVKVLAKVVLNAIVKFYVITSKVCFLLFNYHSLYFFLLYRYYKTSYPSSCSTRWCQTYFWFDLRRSSRCS
jgi:hypothetical protein